MLFTNAQCTSPICGPSRAAVLTGMRPETTGVYHNRGRYKAVFMTDGSAMLFDMRGRFGISEQFDLAEEKTEVVAPIQGYLKISRITTRHVTMPEEE